MNTNLLSLDVKMPDMMTVGCIIYLVHMVYKCIEEYYLYSILRHQNSMT